MNHRPQAAAPAQRLWLAACVLLGLVLPLFALLRARAQPPDPAPRSVPPAWVHLIVLSASELELPRLPPEPTATGALVRLARRATHLPALIAPASERAAVAASFWTGLYPAGHGVYSASQGLAPGQWSLAEAARQSGTATCALLAEPFVSTTRIAGFDTLLEERGLDAARAGALAADFLEQHRETRTLLWLHLESAGPAELEACLGALERALPADGRRIESSIAVMGFAHGSARGEARWVTPWLTELPSALFAGRSSRAQLSLVDATSALAALLRLPGPGSSATALQGRSAAFEGALKGAMGTDFTLLQKPQGDLFSWQGARLETTARPAVREGDYRFPPQLAPEQRLKLAQFYRERLQAWSAPARALAVEPPAAWRDHPSW